MFKLFTKKKDFSQERPGDLLKIVIGLGNFGKKYQTTRHNIAWLVLDSLAEQEQASFSKKQKFLSEIAELKLDDAKVVLIKPLTFMNQSGKAVSALKKIYKFSNNNLLVVQDEIDLEFGKLKISKNSGSAGHRGTTSVIEVTGKNISRLRIGIDSRGNKKIQPTESYVLQNFSSEELKELEKTIVPDAVQKVRDWLKS